MYLLLLSNDCSSIQALLLPGTFMVSIGKTPLSVAFAIANFPFSPTAFQPPNSVISFTVPGSTFCSSPRASISFTFLLFSITFGNVCNFSTSSSTLAFARGAVYTLFAAGSVSVVAPSVRNGLFLSRACPLRESCLPEFAIELLSVAFSVLLAFLPTVAFPSVVSSLGLSTCALGLLRKPLFTVIKSLL